MVVLLFLMLSSSQAPAPPPRLPPDDSPVLVRSVEIAFPAQGGVSVVDPETYRYYVHTIPSRPATDEWTRYDPQTALDDFRRLWATGFLDDLSVEVSDEPYENGVIGKRIVFNLLERRRVKTVNYIGSKSVDAASVERRLDLLHVRLAPDSFLDEGRIRNVEGILREMLKEKGFQSASVTHRIEEQSDARHVRLTFELDEGPKVKIRRVTFVGASAISERALRRQLASNKPKAWWLPSFVPGAGSYQDAMLGVDAERIVQYYRDNGYVMAVVGTPEVHALEDSSDGKTRWVELRIPVTEGSRYRVGAVTFEGNTVLAADVLQQHFSLASRAYYDEREVRRGLQKVSAIYGAAGYFDFTGYPELTPAAAGEPTVDVRIRFHEGAQHFVNRITVTGNAKTRDAIVRRELGIAEGRMFDAEALQKGITRLNQLGYFRPITAANVSVTKTPRTEDALDVGVAIEEQAASQPLFGLGVSQSEGLFGNVSYTTANLFGRGQSLTLTAEQGTRAHLYQVGFAEPYLFGRAVDGAIRLSAGKTTFDVDTSEIGYSEARKGATFSVGRSIAPFARVRLGYTYEVVDVAISDSLLSAVSATPGTPAFSAADMGRHVEGRLAPAFVYNTIDNPLMPHRGLRVSGGVQVAGRFLGGSYDYVKPELEATLYRPLSARTGFGIRGQGGLLHMYGGTTTVPYYLRYFLGGENQIRGVDLRSVGPLDASNRTLGGYSFVLFNAEYYVDVARPVRLVAFHDAGQAFDASHPFNLGELRTSAGVELRVVVPFLNVPFRFIYFRNLSRDVFQPAQGFKFAIGTTF